MRSVHHPPLPIYHSLNLSGCSIFLLADGQRDPSRRSHCSTVFVLPRQMVGVWGCSDFPLTRARTSELGPGHREDRASIRASSLSVYVDPSVRLALLYISVFTAACRSEQLTSHHTLHPRVISLSYVIATQGFTYPFTIPTTPY